MTATRPRAAAVALYDASGDPVDIAPGQTVTMPLGEFVSVPSKFPWDACGSVRADMARAGWPPLSWEEPPVRRRQIPD